MSKALHKAIEARAQREVMEYCPHWVDRIALVDGVLEVTGWALSEAHDGVFLVNGAAVKDVDWTGGLAQVFDTLPPLATQRARYHFKTPCAAERLIKIEYCADNRPDLRSGDTAWYLAPREHEAFPLPEGDNLNRVIVGEELAYRLGGATTAHRLDAYVRRVLGKHIAEIGRVLDWGCGCARVLRYLATPGAKIEGADIDDFNVAWCKTNLPEVPVTQIALMPQTPYEDDRFDFVFGISVMTHLREPAQDAWLNELSRIVRPGGHVAVSIMGSVNQCIGGQSGRKMSETIERGLFITDESNDQIQKDIEGESYYVNVAHAPWYILEHWTSVSPFEIVDIARGLATGQDIILLRNAKAKVR